MQTYNQIITALSGIASAHKQIKQFGAGDEWELVLNSKTYMEYQYPILWVVDQPATVDGTVVTTNFRLIVADRVLKGESNERDVKSDTFQIALDVMAQLYDITQGQGYVWQLVRNTQLQPFTEKYDDILSGWAFDIQLQQSYNWSSCSVPSGTPTGYSPEYVTIFDTDGVTVLARIEPSGSYTVQGGGGGTVTITDSLQNVLYVVAAPATQPIGNSTVNVRKTGGGLISAVSVVAEGTDDYTVADSPVTVNAAAFANVKATESQEVPVQYPDNTATGTISSGVVRINNNRFNIASAWKTGQTTSYAANDDGARQEGAGVDFFTLSENNPFGNTNRFTDTLGGQTYANDIVVDWAGADYVGKTVPIWDRRVRGAAGAVGGAGISWATAMALQPLIIAGEEWYIPNRRQASDICFFQLSSGSVLGYTPFNITSTHSTGGLWTTNTNVSDSAQAIRVFVDASGAAATRGNGLVNGGKAASVNFIVLRTATFAELGITNY